MLGNKIKEIITRDIRCFENTSFNFTQRWLTPVNK
jgi:hypothetical protein